MKLMAQIEDVGEIEPLPDIDFNLRAGNTLVGFVSLEEVREALGSKLDLDNATSRVEEEAEAVGAAYREFHSLQTKEDAESSDLAVAKDGLRKRLWKLNSELNRYLAKEYGANTNDEGELLRWQESHRPFHWFVEFYEILNSGGFDAIVGNPPYIELRGFSDYSIRGYRCASAGNLYALVIERCLALCSAKGRQGYIVPVSSVSTDRYQALQELLGQYDLHYASFDDRPSRLFDGLEHSRLTIHLLGPHSGPSKLTSTRYNKWYSEERAILLEDLVYSNARSLFVKNSLPKLYSATELGIVEKLAAERAQLARFYARSGTYPVYYSRKIGYFLQVLDFQPRVTDGKGSLRPPSEFKRLLFESEGLATAALCSLNSNLFYWFVTVFSDCRHVNKREVDAFPVNLVELSEGKFGARLRELGEALMESLRENSETRQMRFSHDTLTIQFVYPRLSKPVIDEIDHVLACHYGFTDEELDFIVNYDIKYRMGSEAAR